MDFNIMNLNLAQKLKNHLLKNKLCYKDNRCLFIIESTKFIGSLKAAGACIND